MRGDNRYQRFQVPFSVSPAKLTKQLKYLKVENEVLHPNEEWVVGQADSFVLSFVRRARDQGLPVRMVQRDSDTEVYQLVRLAAQEPASEG